MARFTKSFIPSVEYIEELALEAAGNPDKLKELGALAEKLGRRANQNLRELEKKGFESDAYKYAKNKVGEKPRYSQAHTGDAMTLAENAIQSATFLRMETSTVGGVRRKSKKGFKKLVQKTLEREKLLTGIELSEKEKKRRESQMTKFLNSKVFDELRVLGSDIIEAAAEKIEQGFKVEDLLKAFKQYEAGDLDGGILTVWDNWVKG